MKTSKENLIDVSTGYGVVLGVSEYVDNYEHNDEDHGNLMSDLKYLYNDCKFNAVNSLQILSRAPLEKNVQALSSR